MASMTGTVDKAVAEIRQGSRSPVYLLHGDELLAKEGAKAIIEALVPPQQHSLSVEAVSEDRDLASIPMRLQTVSLFGGPKVVVVNDSKAFVSKQNIGDLVKKSREAWQERDLERAARQFLALVAAAGEDKGFLNRAARGEISDAAWEGLFEVERDPEAEQWLREVAGQVVAEGMVIPEATGALLARVYEETIRRGFPANASLVLTAEVVDKRRTLFKRIVDVGCVIDCGIRTGKAGETQMRPEAARAKIQERVAAAGKTIAGDAVASIVDRTGFSMRGLESEVEKILLYAGTRPTITAADVREVLSSSREAHIFDLTNAVSSRNAGKALQALRGLMARREPVPQILSVLAGEIRVLILARGALERQLGGTLDVSMPFEAFLSRIQPRLGQKMEGDDGSAAKLLQMHAFRAFNLLKGATRFSMPDLVRGLKAIHELDLALKTSGHPEGLLMEQLLIQLCAPSFPHLFP
jgi:DNA polymerase-3 subunit delta